MDIASAAPGNADHHLLPDPGQFNNMLSNLAWQTADWGMPQCFPKSSAQGFTISDGSLDIPSSMNTKIWGGNQNECSPSSSSDHTSPLCPPQSAQSPISKGCRRRRTRPSEESNKKNRPRRNRELKDEGASRARIREKNRIAANRCRGRQRMAIEKLNTKHDSLEDQNRQLSSTLNALVAERIMLKNMLVECGRCGCELMESYLRDTATRWVEEMEARELNMETE